MNSMRGTAMSDVLPYPGEASRAKPNWLAHHAVQGFGAWGAGANHAAN